MVKVEETNKANRIVPDNCWSGMHEYGFIGVKNTFSHQTGTPTIGKMLQFYCIHCLEITEVLDKK